MYVSCRYAEMITIGNCIVRRHLWPSIGAWTFEHTSAVLALFHPSMKRVHEAMERRTDALARLCHFLLHTDKNNEAANLGTDTDHPITASHLRLISQAAQQSPVSSAS